ncbi:GNAT family N-acetyltransferase [Clostridium sp. D2Q-11]|uniref:GNAT family N-acetyltransferase n=1 Tax=Anaeromonas frigoriresistens TaxID=2683708 RepID=A0A942UTR1_9FIRM|nr:GNAT family N-acetyltransferase [Anaeromonas frigoriresistens]
MCNFETDKNIWLYEDYVKEDKAATRKLFLDRMKEDVKVHDFIISRKKDERKISVGMAYIWSYNDYRKSWEIGYALLLDHQKFGYGIESASLLLKFGFEELKAHKIVGMCNSENIGSSKIMQRIGMRREEIFREELFCNGKWTDQCFFSILDKEYFDNRR